ncbi:ATP-binding protein [Arhodomonas sp. AD133]|uniref:ATP-binding protein n=1 Tax=Arhodomonas sp. AD133 TaxID=3415009 RepID=UPI003EBCD3BD
MTGSLHRRLLLTAAAVTLAFTIITGVALDQAFRQSALAAQRERLLGHVHTLLAAVDVGDAGVTLVNALPEPRLSRPGSGLYAWLLDANGEVSWHSRSTLGRDLPQPGPVPAGTMRFQRVDSVFRLDYGVLWEPANGPPHRFSVTVAESPATFVTQTSGFRRTLFGWLALGAIALLAGLGLTVHWGLAPLRRVAREVADMNEGGRDALASDYPREIALLTDNINALAESERERTRRYRHGLDNLAHSLKTPLAVLRSALASRRDDDLEVAAAQVERIDRSLDYHVRRTGAGSLHASERTPVTPVIERLVRVLEHARTQTPRAVTIDCPVPLAYSGTEDDLMEIAGNLVDNAWKYARSEIRVSTEADDAGTFRLTVEDDGPGIPAAVRDAVTRRGVRLDEHTPGEGIGLAVVGELVAAAGGTLSIDASPLGGTRVHVKLPGAPLVGELS